LFPTTKIYYCNDPRGEAPLSLEEHTEKQNSKTLSISLKEQRNPHALYVPYMPPHGQNFSAGAVLGLLHLLHFSFPSTWRELVLRGGGARDDAGGGFPILAAGGGPWRGDGPTGGGSSEEEAVLKSDREEVVASPGPRRGGGGPPIFGDLGVAASSSGSGSLVSLGDSGTAAFDLGGGPEPLNIPPPRTLETLSSRACSSSADILPKRGIANKSS